MFIIYHTRAFARKIPRELRVTSLFPRQNVRSRRRNSMSVAVNWGCAPSVLRGLYSGRILNADISGSLLKMNTFELLDAAGLAHPRVTRDVNDRAADNTPFYMRGKYLGRRDGLSGGKGIVVYEKGTRPPAGTDHDFYSQVVSKALEVRIHVARLPSGEAEIICEQVKYIPQGSNVLIRNYENGARFSAVPLHSRIDSDVASAGRLLALRALDACHLDFAAFDLALTQRGQWVIFEANSAPGITRRDDTDAGSHEMPASYDAYLAYFRRWLSA